MQGAKISTRNADRVRESLDAMNKALEQQPPQCRKCWGSGHTSVDLIDGYLGLEIWCAHRVSPDRIPWCDCDAGNDKRREYKEMMHINTQRIVSNAFEAADVPIHFRGLTLDGIPPALRIGKERAMAAAQEFMDQGYVLQPSAQPGGNPTRKPGLAFIGPVGVGKTGILSVAFQHLVSQGTHQGLWLQLYEFFGEIQAEYTKENSQADAKIRAAQYVDLLFLDDAGDPDRRDGRGIAPETDDKRRVLMRVLSHRHANDMVTFFTSNLDERAFRRQWGDRVADRIWELCWVIAVEGAKLRGQI